MTEEKRIEYATSNLAFAAYLKITGFELLDFELGQKFKFIFRDDKKECDKKYVEFLNSEFNKYDAAIRDLKKLMRG
jgi:hypothetical protein